MQFLEKKNLSRIGRVNKAFGFKGELSCLITVAHPEKLLRQKFLFVLIDGLPVPFQIQNMEIRGEEMMVKFEDIDNEEQAKKLGQKELYSEKISAKKKEDVITWKDLEGYHVIDSVYGDVGTIHEVVEYPMQMIAKVHVKENEVMFPLIDEIVTDVDDEKKIIYVDLPDGLLELYFGEKE